MTRFNQRWVNPSNLRLDGPEKVRRLKAFVRAGSSNLLTSSTLFRHFPTRAHMRTRTRVMCCVFRLDKGRRLDNTFVYTAFNRLTCRPSV